MSVWACSCLANSLSHFSQLHAITSFIYIYYHDPVVLVVLAQLTYIPHLWSQSQTTSKTYCGCPMVHHLTSSLHLPLVGPFSHGLHLNGHSHWTSFRSWLTFQWTFSLDLLSVLTYISTDILIGPLFGLDLHLSGLVVISTYISCLHHMSDYT